MSHIFDIESYIPYTPPSITNERSAMSFREKSAWISLVSLVVVFGAYFSYIGMVLAGLARDRFALFFVMAAVFIIAEVVLHLVSSRQRARRSMCCSRARSDRSGPFTCA